MAAHISYNRLLFVASKCSHYSTQQILREQKNPQNFEQIGLRLLNFFLSWHNWTMYASMSCLAFFSACIGGANSCTSSLASQFGKCSYNYYFNVTGSYMTKFQGIIKFSALKLSYLICTNLQDDF